MYRPTTSRTFAMNSGSVLSFHVSTHPGPLGDPRQRSDPALLRAGQNHPRLLGQRLRRRPLAGQRLQRRALGIRKDQRGYAGSMPG
jgi:hypothetical protein